MTTLIIAPVMIFIINLLISIIVIVSGILPKQVSEKLLAKYANISDSNGQTGRDGLDISFHLVRPIKSILT